MQPAHNMRCMPPVNKLLANIGLPKTGTTYLGSVLKKSVGVSVSRVKEPSFFIKREHYDYPIIKKVMVKGNLERGHKWYISLFDETRSLLVDQSTQYWLNQKNVIDAASDKYEFYPYVICRNPIAQIKSYVAHLRRGYLPNRSLEEICQSDPEFKKYLISMYDFSKRSESKRGVIDGILYLDFDLLVSEASEICALISSYTGTDIRVTSSGDLVAKSDRTVKNERGYPKSFAINAFVTSSFVKRVGALTPSFIYSTLIAFRKWLIRFNLRPGNSQWAQADFEYLQVLLSFETT
jgi:hypothetical protein